MKKFATIAAAALLSVWASSASATLMLDPTGAVASGPETSQAAIDAVVLPLVSPSTEVYKSNVGGINEGTFASSYDVTYGPDPTDPEDAEIVYLLGQPVLNNATHLLVKDGSQDPGWYLFDIGGWDGVMSIELTGFWPQQGAISHISIYAGGGGFEIPEAGVLGLFGLSLIGLGIASRRRRAA